MQAISRNTASVAQDFHNAGGENLLNKITQNNNKGVITVFCNNNNNYNSGNIRDINQTNGTIGQQQKKKFKAMSPIDHHSPPATLELITNSIKRRRKSSSSNDKENVNELLTKQLTFLKQQHQMFLQNLNASIMSDSERLKAVCEINEIFESMYRNSLTIISTIQNDDDCDDKILQKLQPKIKIEYDDDSNENDENRNENEQNYILPAFLRNNKEITVIMDTKNRSKAMKCEESPCEIRKNRKQLKPKKIEKEMTADDVRKMLNHRECEYKTNNNNNNSNNTANINNLRDKHMLKLVTKKKCCYICRNKSIDANSYYSKESLLLHNLWRHTPKKLECHRCESKFNKIYKLKLHKTLEKH